MPSRSFLTRPLNWSLIIGALCCLVALIAYFVGGRDASPASVFTISHLLLSIGLILLVVGLAIRYELEQVAGGLWQRVQLSELARRCERFGLEAIEADASKFTYDFSQIFSESRDLTIVLNDGRTWASVQRDNFRRRFADPSKQTTIFLSHPESAMLHVLARKGSTDVATIKGRISQTVTLLEEIKQPSTSLELLGHHLFNPYSLIISDDSAIIVPYFISRGGRTVPLFKFKDVGEDCYFRRLVEDVERLRIDAEDISTSKNREGQDGVVRILHR